MFKKTSKIFLSVIIVNWNTKELLKECFNSLIADIKHQKKDKEIEIVVVDNGSTDGSVEEIENFKFKIANLHSKFKIVLNKSNLGFAKAVNQGIRQTKGEVILLLNSDTKVKLDALGKLLEFEKKVRPAIIGLRMLNPDGTIQGSVFNLPTVKRAVEEFWLGRKNTFLKYAPLREEPMEVEAVSGGAMAISRQVIEKIGLFDERYFMYFEDLDYCKRALKAGFKIWYLPTAQVIHHHGASGRTLTSPENQWRRLIPSSKIYHGNLKHWLITQIIRIGQLVKKNEK